MCGRDIPPGEDYESSFPFPNESPVILCFDCHEEEEDYLNKTVRDDDADEDEDSE
jgi:hypothetical protein